MSLTGNDSPVDSGDDSSYQLMLLLRTAYFSLRRKCNAICHESECNWDQFVVLGILYDQPGGVTQQFISEESGYDPATMGTMLKTMERNGLLGREPHPVDRRAKRVQITSVGRKVFRRLWRESIPLRETFIGCMSQNRRKHAFKILELISDAMDSQGA